MGDWSKEPWGNDEAVDWFARFWKHNDLTLAVNEVVDFDPAHEKFDALRAACYVLICFGHVYTWPTNMLSQRGEILLQAVNLLEKMIDTNDEWGFLDMWGNDAKIIQSVQFQIDSLHVLLTAK